MADEPTPRLPDPSKPRRTDRSSRSPEQANAATLAALLGMGMMAFAFIGLVALVLPQIRGLVFVFLGAVGFFALHYVVWGWWLPKVLHREDDDDPDDTR